MTILQPRVRRSPLTATAVRDQARTVEVLGHRGAPGYRPEHTLASYELAVRLGADYIEPDVVSTKDGVLVARHENEIGGTTDIAERPELAGRRTTKIIDGVPTTGWFTEDLTLAELKTLRATERLPEVRPGNTRYHGRYEVPTLDEVLTLARTQSRLTGRTIGVVPELKHPTYFASIGLGLEQPLLRSLHRAGLASHRANVVIQCFEPSSLRWLSSRTRVPLLQLTAASGAPYDLQARGDARSYADLMTPSGLREIATYASHLGPEKSSIIPQDVHGRLTADSGLVGQAHSAGLKVIAYTFRDENRYLPTDFRVGDDPHAKGDVFGELTAFFETGVDAVFADQPDSAGAARDWWEDRQQR